MNLKNFFKNKFVIISIVILLLIFISAALTQANKIFMPITSFISGVLCIFWAYCSYIVFKEQTKLIKTASINLDESQMKKVSKELKRVKVNSYIKIVSFIVLALTFIILGINMI